MRGKKVNYLSFKHKHHSNPSRTEEECLYQNSKVKDKL